MTNREERVTLVGELVHDYWRYEYNDIELDGKDLRDLLAERLEYTEVPDGPSRFKRHYGVVRVTIELVAP